MEWLADTQWLWWVGLALLLGLIEIVSLDLVFSMLAGAAVVAAGSAAVGANLTIQVLVFVFASMLALALLRPLALRKLKPAGPAERTNTAAYVGRQAEVLREVTDRTGLIKLAGEEWSARLTSPGDPPQPGEFVEVVAIDGATAVVAPLPS